MVTEHPPVSPTEAGEYVGQRSLLSDMPAPSGHGAVCLPETAPTPHV